MADKEAEIVAWMEAVTRMKKHAGETTAVWLQDGVVLCSLANAVSPGAVAKVSPMKAPFKKMENIVGFTDAARRLGVGESSMFATPDLFEEKNMNSVLNCIYTFACTIQTSCPGYRGPKLGQPINAKVNFTDKAREKVAATQMGGFTGVQEVQPQSTGKRDVMTHMGNGNKEPPKSPRGGGATAVEAPKNSPRGTMPSFGGSKATPAAEPPKSPRPSAPAFGGGSKSAEPATASPRGTTASHAAGYGGGSKATPAAEPAKSPRTGFGSKAPAQAAEAPKSPRNTGWGGGGSKAAEPKSPRGGFTAAEPAKSPRGNAAAVPSQMGGAARTSPAVRGAASQRDAAPFVESGGADTQGLDADLKKRMADKFDTGMAKQVCQWIEAVTGERQGGQTEADWLKDGQVLCALANRIEPGTVKDVHTGAMPFKQMENIKAFLGFCRKLGMAESMVFSTPDLFEEKNMGVVIQALYSFGGVVQAKTRFAGPKLGMKAAR